jgi:soluble cytochrome b562
MDKITFDTSIDLADRIGNVEKAIDAIVDAINALPDTSAFASQLDAFKTDLDGLSGRLDGDEKTISAIGDALKTLSPANVEDVTNAIADIKKTVNAFHSEVYGPANPNVPFPVPPASAPS